MAIAMRIRGQEYAPIITILRDREYMEGLRKRIEVIHSLAISREIVASI
jgi:hypothetical protein